MAPQDRQLNRLLRQRGTGPQRQVESDFFKITIGQKASIKQPNTISPPKQPLAARRSARKTPQPLPQRQFSGPTPASRAKPGTALSARRTVSAQTNTSNQGSLRSQAQAQAQQFHTPVGTGKRKRTHPAAASPEVKEEVVDEIAGDGEHHSTAKRVTKTPSTHSSLSWSGRSLVEPDELAADPSQFPIFSAGRSVPIPKLRKQSGKLVNAEINTALAQSNPPAAAPSNTSSSPPVSVPMNKGKLPSPSITRAEAEQENRINVPSPKIRVPTRRVLSVSKEHVSGKDPAAVPTHDGFAIPAVMIQNPIAHAKSRTENGDHLSTSDPRLGTRRASTPHHASASAVTSPLFQPRSNQYLHDHQANQEYSDNEGFNPVRGDSDDELVPGPSVEESRKGKRKAKLHRKLSKQSRLEQKRSVAEDSEAQSSKRQKTHKGTLVPVTVYRPSVPVSRLTSTRQDSKSDQDDLAYDPITEPDSAVNPVDVLAQITSELISSYITSFSEKARMSSSSQRTGTGTLSAQARRRRHALQRFNFVLSDSLLTLSTTLNAGTALEGRLRKIKRQRVHLREELLQLRQQRDDVRRRIDEVRAQHTRKMELAERRRDLAQGLEDLAEAVRRGKNKARVEGRSDEVAAPDPTALYDDVRALVGDGGLVGRVRAWNERLELVAAGQATTSMP